MYVLLAEVPVLGTSFYLQELKRKVHFALRFFSQTRIAEIVLMQLVGQDFLVGTRN